MAARGVLVVVFVVGCGRFHFDETAPEDASTVSQGCVTQVAVGRRHTCALRTNGTIACWGANDQNQLAQPAGDASLVPVEIALPAAASALAVAGEHSCALLVDGSVMCWGEGDHGELGDGGMVNRGTPVLALPAGSAIAIAAGAKHTCAVLADGTASCWGATFGGATPSPVAGVSGATAIASGHRFTCTLGAGTVTCWGINGDGELGGGTLMMGVQPAEEVSGLTDAVSLSAGGRFACAVRANGHAVCWGDNTSGQLGIATFTQNVPAPSTEVIVPPVTQIAGGSRAACALLPDGSATCWGENFRAQLGNGSLVDNSMPGIPVIGLANATSIASGNFHSCAVLADGVACWGANDYGQLGDGTRSASFTPVAAMVPNGASALDSGMGRVCARYSTGDLWCWGTAWLGDGASGWHGVPVKAMIKATQDSVGWQHTCALTNSGGTHVACWGANYAGQLGNGSHAPQVSPQEIVSLAGAVQVVAGQDFACAILGTGVKCWGGNSKGQLGDGTMTDRLVPTTVGGLLPAIAEMRAGAFYACGIVSADASLRCWGDNAQGQLGDGTTTNRSSPVAVAGVTAVSHLALGTSHACAISGGAVTCWGSNTNGQLGDGTTTRRPAPTPVSLPATAVAIAAGQAHTCAVLADQSMWCWGANTLGQLGMVGGDAHQPVQVPGIAATTLTAGQFHTCVVTTAGEVRCWGNNVMGSLGDGAVLHQTMAQRAAITCP